MLRWPPGAGGTIDQGCEWLPAGLNARDNNIEVWSSRSSIAFDEDDDDASFFSSPWVTPTFPVFPFTFGDLRNSPPIRLPYFDDG